MKVEVTVEELKQELERELERKDIIEQKIEALEYLIKEATKEAI